MEQARVRQNVSCNVQKLLTVELMHFQLYINFLECVVSMLSS